jgi:hypothetical protein
VAAICDHLSEGPAEALLNRKQLRCISKQVEAHLPPILARRDVPLELAMATYEQVSAIVQELPFPYYAAQEGAARARIEMHGGA